ncbi:uncharacterized protein LOC18025741 [Eutrema salsugineum]|uniref:uncharacterized protein LOC18025741 n=1 Tax=Eutrema salsugineum TaxID=72664 RepID=UPI000CED36A7|nr:uncharacterized protein LOC18025741 [Eutrema salsugineum]
MEDGKASNTGMEDGEASNNLSEKLPKRVLGDGCYLVGARLNIYSKANVIGLLVAALKITEDLEKLLHSQFGKLFHLPVARCCNSAKLVHALLSRQLVTTKKHEIWFLFGGQPLRYSIREFKEIPGLNCNPKPDNTEEEEDVGKTGIWKDLFGRATAMNVFDVLEMLKDTDLPRWKRLPLALIVLVDGVLFCNSKNLALTEKYVEMLTDLDRFMLYPWGRNFVEDPEGCQNVITLLHLGDILAVESDPLMVVDDGDNDQQNELRWGDEVEDAEVSVMQELMAEGYKFTPSDFAVAPAPIVDLSDAEDEATNEQEPEPSTRPKKKLKTHLTEKRKMQRKRGRGKNSSNLSEDETPESGQIEDLKRWIVSQNELLLRKIKTELDKRLGVYQQDEEDDDVHQSKEDGEQGDEGHNPKKGGQKPEEDEDVAADGGEEGGDDGAQSSVRHDDGVDGGRTNLVSGTLVVYKPQTAHLLSYAYKKNEAQTDAQDAQVVANEEDSNEGKDYHTAPEDASDASQKTPCTPKPPQEFEGSSGVKRKSRGTGRGGRDSKVKALFVSRSKAAYKPLKTVEQDQFKAFQELLSRERNIDFCIVTGHTVNNQFFLQIAKPTEWVNTMHMQVIMTMLWRRRGEIYLKDRVAFVDTLFISIIGNYYNDFISGDKNQYDWGKTIQGIVLGKPAKWANQRQRQMFLRFVDVVYVPMNWGSEHWVGLVIDFKMGNIKILNSFISHNDETAVEQYMVPMCQSMPFILKRYLDSKLTEGLRTTSYTWSHLEGIYQNKRSGDCGPCAAKFLEMHAAGLGVEDMGLITDDDVDRLREKYAMDSYEEFVGNPAVANA